MFLVMTIKDNVPNETHLLTSNRSEAENKFLELIVNLWKARYGGEVDPDEFRDWLTNQGGCFRRIGTAGIALLDLSKGYENLKDAKANEENDNNE